MITLRSQREIDLMRRAGLVCWQAHQLAGALVRPGITTAEINAAVEQFFAEHKAEPLFKGVPGHVPFPAACCISVNEAVVHGIPGDYVLREGDIVSIDTGCKVNGWCGDSAYTWRVGQVAPRVEELLQTTEAALYLAIDLLGQKQRWSQVAGAMAEFVHSRGFSVVQEFSGHGVGRTMHEEPHVPNYTSPEFEKGHDFDLRPGLVIAVEPMINLGERHVRCLKDHWTQVTTDGLPSAHFEHTIALTKHGPRILTALPAAGETIS